MKRIVDGITYNTATSTSLATAQWKGASAEQITGTLFQTQGGAFFLHQEVERQVWKERDQEHEAQVSHSFIPKSSDDAHQWMLTGDVEIFSNPFDDPPEAAAEAEPGSTIYLRVPASLKRRVDEAAKAADLSGNVWAMRCIEKCLPEQTKRRKVTI